MSERLPLSPGHARVPAGAPEAHGTGGAPEATGGVAEYEVLIAETHYVPFRLHARSAEDAVRQVLDRGLGIEQPEYLEVGERRLESVTRITEAAGNLKHPDEARPGQTVAEATTK